MNDLNKKTELVIRKLSELYPEARAELKFANPFEMLIATILSAQCTDKRVNMVTEKLFGLYPTPQAIAALKVEELEALIRECGLYHMKAVHISEACKKLVSEYGGIVPDNREALMQLPGVGQKTAGVVLMAAFGKDEIPVDTHVFRVSNRIGLCNTKTANETEICLRTIIKPGERGHMHHLLIWHGRRCCKAIHPNCDACPLSNGICEKNI